jgi:twitching motility protein PilT
MTVEDPIEFLHEHKGCLVNQREVGEDTWSFKNALKHVLRQDPDIILVGEMRDLETIEIALTAAETGPPGHGDAAHPGRRADHRPRHRRLPAVAAAAGAGHALGALQGVVCQQLGEDRGRQGPGRRLRGHDRTPAIRNLIREGKTHQIYSALQAGAKHGMQTWTATWLSWSSNDGSPTTRQLEKCHHVEDFNRLCGRG